METGLLGEGEPETSKGASGVVQAGDGGGSYQTEQKRRMNGLRK